MRHPLNPLADALVLSGAAALTHTLGGGLDCGGNNGFDTCTVRRFPPLIALMPSDPQRVARLRVAQLDLADVHPHVRRESCPSSLILRSAILVLVRSLLAATRLTSAGCPVSPQRQRLRCVTAP